MSWNQLNRFAQYWPKWERTLKELVTKKSARLLFPSLMGPQIENEGQEVRKYYFDKPLLIYNAPSKSSSKKKGVYAIFIDGHFSFVNNDDTLTMSQTAANVTFYEIEQQSGNAVHLKLFEALHFDMELASRQTPYHPIFHVQRGTSNTLTERVIRDAIIEQAGFEDANITIDNHDQIGSPYLRLPTPQLDYFSVIVMIIADFFCNPAESAASSQTMTKFSELIKLLLDSQNVAKHGASAQVLYQRFNLAHCATSAHWYAEYGR
jgi:hypothetical protein